VIVEPKVAVDDDAIVKPLMDLTYITDGEEFKELANAFEVLRSNKADKENIHNACADIAKSLRVSFGIEVTISVVSSVDSLGFYGFNVFPSIECATKIVDTIMQKDIQSVRPIWQKNKNWHIDIDGRLLYDMSNKLTPMELATLLLYYIDQVIFDYDTPIRIAYTIMKYWTKMNFVSGYIAASERLKSIYIIPFMVGCASSSIVFGDVKRLELIRKNSIIGANVHSFERYKSAASKIFQTYGNAEIVDQSIFAIERKIVSVLNWIYEGLGDLRYSSMRLKENMLRHLTACRSPFIRIIFKRFILGLSNVGGAPKVDVNGKPIHESWNPPVNPELQKLGEKMTDDYWKNYIATQEANVQHDFMDKYGNCKKVTREDLDMVRVEAENIGSVDDKIYLLERLYKHIGAIETALDLLKTKDAKKVKQTKNELEFLQTYAQDIRQYIIRFKLQPEKYGLYIKYPAGYEG
jgi:hypothetical protein